MNLQPGPTTLAAFNIGQFSNALHWNLMHDAIVADMIYSDAVANSFASFRPLLVEALLEAEWVITP